jgi:hypothetical protein
MEAGSHNQQTRFVAAVGTSSVFIKHSEPITTVSLKPVELK